MGDLIIEINKWGTSCLRGNMEMLHWPDLKKLQDRGAINGILGVFALVRDNL